MRALAATKALAALQQLGGDDFADNASTTGAVAVGGSTTGRIEEVTDSDWFAVQLVAGQTYQFDVGGIGGDPLVDPVARLYDAAGNLLVFDNHSGPGLDAQITHTAATAGTFFLQVNEAGLDATGDYQVSLQQLGWDPAAGVGTTLFTMNFVNSEAAPSTGLVKFGVSFQEGQVATGEVPRVRSAGGSASYRTRFINEVRHPDGSLKFCHLVVDLGALTSSQTLSNLEVYSQAVSLGGASPIDPWVFFNSETDTATVDVENHSGSASGALPDRAYNLKTALATTTRRTIFNQNDLYTDGVVWQQEPGGEHLTAEFYFNIWTPGTDVGGVELAPVMSQHWLQNNPFGGGTNKERRNYDATIKWGATTLNTHTGLAHAYHNQWVGVRQTADAQRARPHWVDFGTARPTVRVIYSDEALDNFYITGILPPIDYNETFDAGAWSTSYAPLFEQDMSRNPNATGAHPERGLIPDPMARLLADQSEARQYQARINAHAGLTSPIHNRDHRLSDAGDVSNGLVPPTFDELSPGTFSYTGLGPEAIFVKKSGSVLTFSAPNGGAGRCTEPDEAHISDYCGTSWIMEGEQYMLAALLDTADFTMRRGNWNDLDHDTRLYFYTESTTRRANLSIPNTLFGHLPDYRAQPRNWVPNIVGVAYATCPDANRHKPMFDNVIANSAQYFDIALNGDGGSYAGFPAAHKSFGVLYSSDSRSSFWNLAFTAMSLYRLANAASGANKTAFLAAAHQSAQPLVRMVEQDKFFAFQTYRAGWLQNETTFEDYLPTDGSWLLFPVSIAAATDVLTIEDALETGYGLTAGDRVYFSTRSAESTAALPSEVSLGTVYYVQNVSGSTFQLSTDVGGSSIVNFTSDYATSGTGVNLYIDPADYSDIYATVGASGSALPNDDDYLPICEAAIDMAWANNHPNLTSTAYSAFKTWAAPLPHAAYGPWAMDGTLIRALP